MGNITIIHVNNSNNNNNNNNNTYDNDNEWYLLGITICLAHRKPMFFYYLMQKIKHRGKD